MIPTHYIKRLIAEGEHLLLDFKFEISDTKKIARSLVAFANTKGGRLLVGVKDNGAIAGVRSDEEYYMIETAAHLYCRPEVTFTAKNWTVDGKTVVEIIVEPSDEKPHYAPGKEDKWTAFIRVKDQNQVAPPVIVKVWERQKRPGGVYVKYSDAERNLLSYIGQYGDISLSKASKVAGVSPKKAVNLLANLIAIDMLELHFTDDQVLYGLKTIGDFDF
jgi:predicted HTH transcriptional regulator